MGCRVGFSGVMLASSPQYCRDWFIDGDASCNFAYLLASLWIVLRKQPISD